MQHRAKVVINGLLRKLNIYERTFGSERQAISGETIPDTAVSSASSVRNRASSGFCNRNIEVTYKTSLAVLAVVCILVGTLIIRVIGK